MVNGACAPCRAKKKRCIHRDLPAEAVEAVEAETDSTNMPAPISVSKGRPKAANKATEESEAVEDNPAQSTEVAGTETTENNTVQNNAKVRSLILFCHLSGIRTVTEIDSCRR